MPEPAARGIVKKHKKDKHDKHRKDRQDRDERKKHKKQLSRLLNGNDNPDKKDQTNPQTAPASHEDQADNHPSKDLTKEENHNLNLTPLTTTSKKTNIFSGPSSDPSAMASLISASRLGTASDVYLYSLAASPSSSTLATIGSDDTLRIFSHSLSPLHSISSAHAGISTLTSTTTTTSHFITGGRDSVIKVWDSRNPSSSSVLHTRDPRGNGISALSSREHYIAAGTESTKEGLGDVSVLIYDTRNISSPVRSYLESHTDSITQLAFHPIYPNILLSGSTDGLVSLFDINHTDEEDALQQVLNPRSAVHCAGFMSESEVYVVSTDEQYSIYSLAKTAEEDEDVPPPVQFGDVRERLQGCMYVVGVIGQRNGPRVMAYGNTKMKRLELVGLGEPGRWEFGRKVILEGAHGEEVVRDVLIDGERAYTCGEDGMVKLWSLGA